MDRIIALIFAKFPEPGRVKTRMVPPLTFEQAAALHRVSLAATCDTLRDTALHTVLVVTPDDAAPSFCEKAGLPPMKCRPQGGGDLGARLARAMRVMFDDGASGIILLGADSPTLPKSFLLEACRMIAAHDAVMGPCDDGGYYLLGLRRPADALFDAIDWGSARVAEQTRAQAAASGLDLAALPSWYDLDHHANLPRALADLRAGQAEESPARIALRELIESLL